MVGQGHRLSDIAVRNPEPPWHSVPSRLSSAAAGTSRALAPVHKSQAQQHLSENTPLRSQSLKAATEVIELVDSLSSLTMALILKLRTPYGRSTKKKHFQSPGLHGHLRHPLIWVLTSYQLWYRRNDLKKSFERFPGHFLTMFDPYFFQVKPPMTLQKTSHFCVHNLSNWSHACSTLSPPTQGCMQLCS